MYFCEWFGLGAGCTVCIPVGWPVSRIELGEDRVQGTDYYYTLQGWLKGMNTPAAQSALVIGPNGYNLTGEKDMGNDGAASSPVYNSGNKYIAQDEYMMGLGYYSTDYAPIGTANLGSTAPAATANLWNITMDNMPSNALYNGNIAYWISDRSRTNTRDNVYVYTYDQLNRLRRALYSISTTTTSNEIVWNTRPDSWMANDLTNISYDLNGNLKTMVRRGRDNAGMDNLVYNYNYVGGRLVNNKLNNVFDYDGYSGYDVKSQAAGNYEYDNIGNLTKDVSEEIANITWNREGKVTGITRIAGSLKAHLSFKYDVSGRRIYKTSSLYTSGGALSSQTNLYYAYDASGNVMATYDNVTNTYPAEIRQVNTSIYGSSRLGMYAHATPVTRNIVTNGVFQTSPYNTTSFSRRPGYKQYELTDHLGNVRTVISGLKYAVSRSANVYDKFYMAQILAEKDYYPFGMEMQGGYRIATTLKYRFGYNGKPSDDDWNGDGAMYDYGFRIYDPRIAKFLSVDPLSPSYPWYTPYQFAGNRPIDCIDLDGLEELSFLEASERAIFGEPIIQKNTEWIIADRLSISINNNSFYNASIINTKNGNAHLYTSISQRHDYYEFAQKYIDANPSTAIPSKWFGAAAIVTKWNAVGAGDKINTWYFGPEAEDFVTKGNAFLLSYNMANLKGIMSGKLEKSFINANGFSVSTKGLTGKALNYALVQLEQTKVQEFIVKYKTENPNADMSTIMYDINYSITSMFGPGQVYDVMAENFEGGATFDFSNYNDRVLLGKKLIDKLYE